VNKEFQLEWMLIQSQIKPLRKVLFDPKSMVLPASRSALLWCTIDDFANIVSLSEGDSLSMHVDVSQFVSQW